MDEVVEGAFKLENGSSLGQHQNSPGSDMGSVVRSVVLTQVVL